MSDLIYPAAESPSPITPLRRDSLRSAPAVASLPARFMSIASFSLAFAAILAAHGSPGVTQVNSRSDGQPPTKHPERTVAGNVITSERDPKVRIELPRSVRYVGADRWVLYGMADCELHAFVEENDQMSLQRLYWVQFEGYLPTRPELRHTYDSPRHTNIDGYDFYVDTWVAPSDATDEPGSDSEHIKALLRAGGYNIPGMMKVRLVHLLDEQKRKELMIIYGEDLAATGFSVDDLNQGGKARDRWPAIAEGLIDRARRRISLSPRRAASREPLGFVAGLF